MTYTPDVPPAVIRVGERFTHGGVEYIINRLTPQVRHDKPLRMQIDCTATEEVVRRHNNLRLLLAGVAAPGDSESDIG